MEFTDQDVIDCSSILKHGINSPLVTEELANLIAEKCSHIAEYYKKDDDKFRKNCLEVFDYFYNERECWELMLLIREITFKDISITYKVVPEFQELVGNYGTLIRKARSYKEENNEQ